MKPPFANVVKQYLKLVYFFAHRWAGSIEHVDDIVQETFYKALQKYESFRFSTESELKAWLLTICRNHIYNLGRKKKEVLLDAEKLAEIPDETTVNSMLESLIKEEQHDNVVSYLEKRSFVDQELIRLYVYEALTFKQVAALLSCSEDAAKKRFYRLLANIKKEVSL